MCYCIYTPLQPSEKLSNLPKAAELVKKQRFEETFLNTLFRYTLLPKIIVCVFSFFVEARVTRHIRRLWVLGIFL